MGPEGLCVRSFPRSCRAGFFPAIPMREEDVMSRQGSANRSIHRWITAAALAGSASLFALPLAAQTGSVSGRVTDAATGAPVPNAQVMVVGTTIGAAVDSDGRFRLTGVPAGGRQ